MAGKLPMGQKELIRAKIMEQVVQKLISLKDASIKLKVSYRQAKRILKKYRQEGDKGLLHKLIGQPSHHRINQEVHKRAVLLYEQQYPDFGPTLAAEKLAECHDLAVHHETLRRWLIAAGLWKRHRRRTGYRSRRDRRPCFGELVQFDGSHHDWFEERASKCCLMNMVDDATGTTMAFLCEEETTASAMILLWHWILSYGIPQAVYCDKKNAFVLNHERNIEEQLKGEKVMSHFERACQKLGIEVITANSPQAKGRVERNHGVYQDRFVKELRLAGISTIEQANEFLESKYLPKINKKFSKKPAIAEDAHVHLTEKIILSDIFCFEENRTLSNDYVISYNNRLFQILKDEKYLVKPKDRIIVRELLDGTIKLIWEKKSLVYKELSCKSKKEVSAILSA